MQALMLAAGMGKMVLIQGFLQLPKNQQHGQK